MLVLFDIDGTLVDSDSAWINAYGRVLEEKYGARLTADEVVHKIYWHDRSTLSNYGVKDADEFYASLDPVLAAEERNTRLMPGALEAAEQLKAGGHKLGIITGRRKAISRLYCPKELLALFDRHDCEPKPSPHAVFLACEKTGVPREKAVFVGDTLVDYNTAQAARIPFLLYDSPNNFASRVHAPNAVRITDLRSIPPALERLTAESASKE